MLAKIWIKNNIAIFYINGFLFEIDGLQREASFSNDDAMDCPKSSSEYAKLFTSENLIDHRQEISAFNGHPTQPHSKGKFEQIANVRLLYTPFTTKYSTLGRVFSSKSSSFEKTNFEMTTVSAHWLNQSRRRVLFNKFQITQLEKCFRKQRYLSAQEREELAQSIGLTSTQVCRIIISLDMNLKKICSKIPQMLVKDLAQIQEKLKYL